jgi:hypothetical protein
MAGDSVHHVLIPAGDRETKDGLTVGVGSAPTGPKLRIAAGTGVTGAFLQGAVRCAGRDGAVRPTAIAGVGKAEFQEPIQMIAVERQPIALLVWAAWAAHVRPFIPVNPQPSQISDDPLGSPRADSRPIQILQPEDE